MEHLTGIAVPITPKEKKKIFNKIHHFTPPVSLSGPFLMAIWAGRPTTPSRMASSQPCIILGFRNQKRARHHHASRSTITGHHQKTPRIQHRTSSTKPHPGHETHTKSQTTRTGAGCPPEATSMLEVPKLRAAGGEGARAPKPSPPNETKKRKKSGLFFSRERETRAPVQAAS